MKNKLLSNPNMYILLLLVVAGLYVFSIANLQPSSIVTSSDGITVRVSHEVKPPGYFFQRPLVITPQGTNLNQGDSQTFQETIEIYESCSPLEAIWSLKRGSSVLASDTDSLGNHGLSSVFSQFVVSIPADGQIGTYNLEANWRCNGVILGKDGRFGGTDLPSVTTFQVIGEDEEPEPPTPPPQQRTCYLINSISNSCESIFQPSSSSCESLNRFSSLKECKENIEGSNGGNGNGNSSFDYLILLIIGGVGLIGYALLTGKKKRGK